MELPIMLSDEEMAIFDALHYRIRGALRPATVTKGQVHGLALRLLRAKSKSSEQADSWKRLSSSLPRGSEHRYCVVFIFIL
jgi:hypothetical protein